MNPQATPPYFDDLDGEGLSPKTSHPAYTRAAPGWFWDEGDPRAPFGGDDGNDTLRNLEEYYREGGDDEHAPGLVASMLADWGYVPEHIWESGQGEIVEWLDADAMHIRYLHGEADAFVAAACAQFKIAGCIHPALHFWAERATMLLEHVLDEWEQRAFQASAGRYAERLSAIRAVLAAAPEPSQD
ncbi:hypothetical protein [Gulosibacter sp. 10]|uniref:hypothetical protein n=1 Tax=Gulosibacter sp. 10 TaxID=1255570 RepID=UPI00097F2DB7|nr:hypothetical protein [Gulosibacter sp. 10]SJM70752.1 hypothetical protein FM112_15515 [Gulosibacter sp. 10]